jgi:RNA polymerase sigma factor (sigma-70 family)
MCGKAEAMEFEEEQGKRGIPESDPIPPDEWQGFTAGTRVEAIYAAHSPELTRYFRRRAPAQDVADLVQECFRRFTQSRGPALSLVDRPAAYLVRTARNLLAERIRADGRRMQAHHGPFDEEDHAGPDPHAALEARDTIRRLADVVARLKPKTRAIFLMHRLEGLSYEEIAAAQGMSVKGVEKQMAKALGAIRRSRHDGR